MLINNFSEFLKIMEADLYRQLGKPIDFKQIILGGVCVGGGGT